MAYSQGGRGRKSKSKNHTIASAFKANQVGSFAWTVMVPVSTAKLVKTYYNISYLLHRPAEFFYSA
jgi:hypothetical protein